jgi:hypothetical protein
MSFFFGLDCDADYIPIFRCTLGLRQLRSDWWTRNATARRVVSEQIAAAECKEWRQAWYTAARAALLCRLPFVPSAFSRADRLQSKRR